jgi:hypothetical protein
MAMLTPEERDEIRGSSVARYYLMESTFDLVTGLYPDQRLAIFVDVYDVMNIMDWNSKATAAYLLKSIRLRVNKKAKDPVRVWEFCDYLEIDEMLIQLFLASLSDFHPLPPVQRIDAEIACTRLRTLDEISKELQQGILPSDEVFKKRLQLWDELNPLGELMFKRKGPYRVLIRAFEIAQVCNCNIKAARALLNATLKEAGFPKAKYVSIKKFCEINHWPEDDVRKSLARIHGDDEYEDD